MFKLISTGGWDATLGGRLPHWGYYDDPCTKIYMAGDLLTDLHLQCPVKPEVMNQLGKLVSKFGGSYFSIWLRLISYSTIY